MADIPHYVIDLKEKDSTLEKIGGKAINLARMSEAGFNVPPAFIVSVDAYDFFIKKELEGKISKILDSIDFKDDNSISSGCSLIRSIIKSEELPQNILLEINNSISNLPGRVLCRKIIGSGRRPGRCQFCRAAGQFFECEKGRYSRKYY